MKLKRRRLKKRRRNHQSLQPHLHPLRKRKSQKQTLSLNHMQLCTEEPLMSLWSSLWLLPPEQEKERSLKLKLKRRKTNRWYFGPRFVELEGLIVTLPLGTEDRNRGYSRENLPQLFFFPPLLRQRDKLFVHLYLNLESEERTACVIGIRYLIAFQNSLLLCWSMLSILSYSALFLLLLFPLLFILSSLLFFLFVSLLVIFMSVLLYFLFWFPIAVLFLVTSLLLLRLLMFLSILLSPPLILLISDTLLWQHWSAQKALMLSIRMS